MARTLVVGDVHGCLSEFQALVDKLCLVPGDRVICLGDFMDKGPDPAGCVRFARESGFESLTGNHEDWHLRFRKHEDRRAKDLKYKNPMRPPSEKKLAQNQALSDEDVAWLRGLPTVIVTELWVLVHGGLMPGVALAAQKVDHMLRVRWVDGDNKYVALDPEDPRQPEGTKTWMEVYDGDRNVVYGHAAHSLSTVRKDGPNARGAGCFGIDTGCVYGGRLTAFVLETQEVIQVQARKVYAEPPFPIPA